MGRSLALYLSVAGLVLGVSIGWLATISIAPHIGASTAERTILLRKERFSFDTLPPPWKAIDVPPVDGAQLAFTCDDPALSCVICAEPLSDSSHGDAEKIADVMALRIVSNPMTVPVSHQTHLGNGLIWAGRSFAWDQGHRLWMCWACTSNGRQYEVYLWSPASSAINIRPVGERILDRLHVMPADSSPPASGSGFAMGITDLVPLLIDSGARAPGEKSLLTPQPMTEPADKQVSVASPLASSSAAMADSHDNSPFHADDDAFSLNSSRTALAFNKTSDAAKTKAGAYFYAGDSQHPSADNNAGTPSKFSSSPLPAASPPPPVVTTSSDINLYQSPIFGYSVDLRGLGWTRWQGVADIVRGGDWGAKRGNFSCMTIIPFSLLGHDPDLNAVTTAMLKRMDIPFSDVTDLTKWTVSPATLPSTIHSTADEGYSFSYRRTLRGVTYYYRFRSLKSDNYAVMGAGWSSNLPEIPFVSLAVNRVELHPRAKAGTVNQLTSTEQIYHGLLLNDVGLDLYSRSQIAESSPYFEQALNLRPGDVVMLKNLMHSLEDTEQYDAARTALDHYQSWFPKSQDLQIVSARIDAKTGHADAAEKEFAAIFDTSYRDDDSVQVYADLLTGEHRRNDAIAVVGKYLERWRSWKNVQLYSKLLIDNGDVDGAIAAVKKAETQEPGDTSLPYVLAEALLSAKRYDQALQQAGTLVNADPGSSYALTLRGRADYGLSKYNDAKASFEAAIAKNPSDQVAHRWLEQASAALGEGDNSNLKTVIEPIPLPASLATVATTMPTDLGPEESACILLEGKAIDFHAGKQMTTTDYETARVLNPRGVEKYSAFDFGFDPLFERMYLNRLEVKDTSGQSIATVKAADCYVLDRRNDESVTQQKVLHVPVPGLKPGYTLEMVLTRQEFAGEKMRFKQHLFSRTDPTLRSVLFVRGDLKDLKHTEHNAPPAAAVEGGLAWDVTLPRPMRWEPFQPEYETFLPMVNLGDATADWTKEGNDYIQKIHDVTNPVPETASLAAQILSGLPVDATPSRKLNAMLDYVQHECTYKAIEFGRRARMPQSPANVIHNHYGDCKDHSVLLMQLLHASGIAADLALVRSKSPLDEDVPSLDQFDHMIVYVQDPAVPETSAGRFFDCTDKENNPASPIGGSIAGRDALVLNKDHPQLIRIPLPTPDASSITCNRDVQILANGDVNVHDVINCIGASAGTFRSYFAKEDVQLRQRVLEDLLVDVGVQARVHKLTLVHLEQAEQPFGLDVEYTLTRRFISAGTMSSGAMVGTVPMSWERFWLNCSHVDHRQSPFRVNFPMVFHGTTALHLPPQYKWSAIPAPASSAGDFSTAKLAFVASAATGANTGSSDLTATSEFQILYGTYPASRFGEFEYDRQAVIAELEPTLLIQSVSH